MNGHNRSSSPVPYVEDAAGCWIWQRARNDGGYGRVRVGEKMRLAHVVWFEREFGPVPDGKVLHHVCGRGHEGCMNPRHLVPVTAAENARLGRGTKLTSTQVEQIRREVAMGGKSKSSIARAFGVSDVQVHYIATGRCWREPETSAA